MQQSRLLRYGLRLYVDPEAPLSGPQFWVDLDELQYHTQQLGTPCFIQPCVPDDGRNWSSWSIPHLKFETARPSDEATAGAIATVAEVFFGTDEQYVRARSLASASLAIDCDLVLSTELAARPEITHGFQRLNMDLVDERGARSAIEVFMRGHEIPWAFGLHMWQWPWVVFYPNVESGIKAMDRLRSKAAEAGLSSSSSSLREYIRSLGFSRWSAIAYTRDKLLFFAQQRRAAKRNGIELQDFSFELSYFFNYYYSLLWGGLEQTCWIVNESCRLGFTFRDRMKIGVEKKEFHSRLKRQAPEVAEEFENPDFVKWLDGLKLIRHHSSHQGFPMLASLFAVPVVAPNLEQIDREIETWPDWLEMKETFEPELLEAARPVFRQKWIERNYQLISDAALAVPEKDKFSTVSPLQHIAADFNSFQKFVVRVTELCVTRLSGGGVIECEEGVQPSP